MSKLILILMLSFSSAMALTVKETVANEEFEKSARCEFFKESTKVCFNYYCVRKVFFTCDSAEGSYTMKMRVSNAMMSDGTWNERVKKVKYIK